MKKEVKIYEMISALSVRYLSGKADKIINNLNDILESSKRTHSNITIGSMATDDGTYITFYGDRDPTQDEMNERQNQELRKRADNIVESMIEQTMNKLEKSDG